MWLYELSIILKCFLPIRSDELYIKFWSLTKKAMGNLSKAKEKQRPYPGTNMNVNRLTLCRSQLTVMQPKVFCLLQSRHMLKTNAFQKN